jgi:hypothetical protein
MVSEPEQGGGAQLLHILKGMFREISYSSGKK